MERTFGEIFTSNSKFTLLIFDFANKLTNFGVQNIKVHILKEKNLLNAFGKYPLKMYLEFQFHIKISFNSITIFIRFFQVSDLEFHEDLKNDF